MISGFIEWARCSVRKWVSQGIEYLLVVSCRSLWKQICQYGCQYVTIQTCDQYATKIPCGKYILGLLRKWVGKWIGGIIGERVGRSAYQRLCEVRSIEGWACTACLDVYK